MELSPHFNSEEFEKGGDMMPQPCIGSYAALCKEILEPIREKYGIVYITSGYRSEYHNKQVGGAPASQHVATADYCAADFAIPGADLNDVFDWVRLTSRLPVDQVILEYGSKNDASPGCIHVSWAKQPRYMALEGLTHNQSPYESRTYNAPTDVSA